LSKQTDKTISKARTGTQDVAGEAAKQGVSIGIAQLKGNQLDLELKNHVKKHQYLHLLIILIIDI